MFNEKILHKEYLYQCKNWGEPAKTTLYNHVRLYNMDARRIATRFPEGNPFTPNKHVKSLEYLYKEGVNFQLGFKLWQHFFQSVKK